MTAIQTAAVAPLKVYIAGKITGDPEYKRMPDNSRNRGRDYGSRNGHGYIGRISNDGAQRVEAPIDPNGKRGKEIVKRGNDLRTGNGRK